MTEIIGFILIIITVFFSYKGFTNKALFDGYKFEVDRILINKDYIRLLTSGFLHTSWMHLIFNMISLYIFCGLLETSLGRIQFLLIYFASLIGGNLFSLLVHRHHGNYSAVGASGAICGIMFASIVLFPGLEIGFFMLPISFPSWLYGIVYIAYTIYAVKSNKDNIGHEAHLGGALVGMIIALLLEPSAFADNYATILLIAVPTILFTYLVITKPHILLVNNYFSKTQTNYYSIDHKYNEERNFKQREIDRILEKINRKGIHSLSKKEKELLEEYSQKID